VPGIGHDLLAATPRRRHRGGNIEAATTRQPFSRRRSTGAMDILAVRPPFADPVAVDAQQQAGIPRSSPLRQGFEHPLRAYPQLIDPLIANARHALYEIFCGAGPHGIRCGVRSRWILKRWLNGGFQ